MVALNGAIEWWDKYVNGGIEWWNELVALSLANIGLTKSVNYTNLQ